MIQFTVESGSAGETLLNNATDTNPVSVTDFKLVLSDSTEVSVANFVVSVVKDESGIGNYIVISAEVPDVATEYNITNFKIYNNSTVLATSESVSVYKPANKSIKLRLTCQFEYATRCSFESTVIGLPYATKFREGVVRFAKDKDDPQKANTVYSGDYVEQRIEAVIEAGVDLTKYVLGILQVMIQILVMLH